MTREPYTECRIYVDGIPKLAAGDYLRTSGSAYLVQSIRQNRRRPERRHLVCLRWPPAEIPAEAKVYELQWYPRRRKAARRLS